jgi:3-deoxy-manno-octulosonate cytidylyltransferase (CMP-KDO synthetase)
MTSIDHVSGTDRVQEVCSQCGLDPDEVVVNVQGDEPIIPPSVINQVARNLVSPNVESVSRVATLYEPIDNLQDIIDPNVVKVVVDVDGMALYFSRAPIPWDRDRMPEGFSNGAYKRHVGIYAYKVGMLNEYVTWQADEIELVEKLEQLRILRQGHRIHIDKAVQSIPPGIDTPQDLERTRAYLESRAPQ